jgi:hypothetical protein
LKPTTGLHLAQISRQMKLHPTPRAVVCALSVTSAHTKKNEVSGLPDMSCVQGSRRLCKLLMSASKRRTFPSNTVPGYTGLYTD